MRLTAHQDGWVYGLFCAERKDPAAAPGDLSSAVAQCGYRAHPRFEVLGAAWTTCGLLGAAAQLRVARGICRR